MQPAGTRSHMIERCIFGHVQAYYTIYVFSCIIYRIASLFDAVKRKKRPLLLHPLSIFICMCLCWSVSLSLLFLFYFFLSFFYHPLFSLSSLCTFEFSAPFTRRRSGVKSIRVRRVNWADRADVLLISVMCVCVRTSWYILICVACFVVYIHYN